MAPSLVVLGAVALWYAYFAYRDGMVLHLAVLASGVALVMGPDFMVGLVVIFGVVFLVMHRRGFQVRHAGGTCSVRTPQGRRVTRLQRPSTTAAPEVVTFSDRPSTLAYVLNDEGTGTTLLIEGDRTIRTTRSQTLTSRQVCSLHVGSKTLLDWVRVCPKPTVPTCPEAPDAPA